MSKPDYEPERGTNGKYNVSYCVCCGKPMYNAGATACFSCQGKGAGWNNGPKTQFDWGTGKPVKDE